MFDSDKISYSIGQVSDLTSIAQSTLRYWETVIEKLKPHKTAGGSRRYFRKDVEMILTIKSLLYDQGFTIKGANTYLSKNAQNNYSEPAENRRPKLEAKPEPAKTQDQDVRYILNELTSIKKILAQ